jgi:chromosome segregation ATPase
MTIDTIISALNAKVAGIDTQSAALSEQLNELSNERALASNTLNTLQSLPQDQKAYIDALENPPAA